MDNRRGTLKLTSILRDSQVYIEGYGYDKATHAYAYGGPELAVRTLNQTFHLDITDYVTVNFGEMAQIVDAFGGVEISLTADEKREIKPEPVEPECGDRGADQGHGLLGGRQRPGGGTCWAPPTATAWSC